jgi:DNA repair photolyase
VENASLRGRGAATNPANRFDRIDYERDEDAAPDEGPGPKTELLRDASRTIIAYNDSPDLGFSASLNPYRGCEHGCSYCYARPTHEYAGFSAGLDFETKILVKADAPELLREELAHRSWTPQVVMMSGVTDCYQPAERKLKITRRCLEVFAEFRNPVAVITKNALIARDADVLGELARHECASATVSITTLDPELQRRLEPRASTPANRLAAIEALAKAGVPVGVNAAPIIPGINDHEIPAILEAAAGAGASHAGYVFVRLPYGVKDLFSDWLSRHYPDRKEKVLNQIRESRGGKLYDSRYGTRGRGDGAYAENINGIFRLALKKHGYTERDRYALSSDRFRRPRGPQLDLFETDGR